MKKIIALALSLSLLVALSGCGKADEQQSSSQGTQVSGGQDSQASFDTTKAITVVSREDGSGTRGAFVELTGVEEKNAEGKKEDKTTVEAVIASKTDVMMTNIKNNSHAIGYLSMGSLNSDVKAVKIDSVEPTAENVKNNSYSLSRPFNIATKGEISAVAQDFINYIMSKDGQDIVAKSYITVDDAAPAYTKGSASGKVVIVGSSSVSPLMEKLKEGYIALNPSVTIEIQTLDSTAGITSVVEGACDIGMASRELKDSEKENVTGLAIALDGIAVVVNNENSIENLTKDQVKAIYTGAVSTWDKI